MSAIDEIRDAMSSVFGFEETGDGEYLVHTDLLFDDGYEYHIVLKILNDRYVLTDEGHTMMWLSFEDDDLDIGRIKLLERIIEQNGLSLYDGEIFVIAKSPSMICSTLMSMLQTITKVSDLRYLDQHNHWNDDDVEPGILHHDAYDDHILPVKHILIGTLGRFRFKSEMRFNVEIERNGCINLVNPESGTYSVGYTIKEAKDALEENLEDYLDKYVLCDESVVEGYGIKIRRWFLDNVEILEERDQKTGDITRHHQD